MVSKVFLLALMSFAAAQRCQNYWNGNAPVCKPGGCDSDAYRWWGIVSGSGNGGQCWTGKKRLCQCLAPGSLEACTPTLPPKETKHLNDMFTTCNNGCSAYVCGVDFKKFWKRDVETVKRGGRLSKRLLPCEEHPEQPHCNPPDPPYEPPPPPQPQPTNTISSKPLTPDEVHTALSQIEYGALAQLLSSLGEDTNGKSQSDLVDAAWRQFEASMGNLDLGQVNAAACFDSYEGGPEAWVYYPDRIR
ncbi:MAG: hypothetical protein Q9219_005893 [cf. Caloplaca sp. 3 TL-2023]